MSKRELNCVLIILNTCRGKMCTQCVKHAERGGRQNGFANPYSYWSWVKGAISKVHALFSHRPNCTLSYVILVSGHALWRCIKLRSAMPSCSKRRRLHAVSAALKRSIGGSVVEFSPATREARVRFPANASSILFLFLFFFFFFGFLRYFIVLNLQVIDLMKELFFAKTAS